MKIIPKVVIITNSQKLLNNYKNNVINLITGNIPYMENNINSEVYSYDELIELQPMNFLLKSNPDSIILITSSIDDESEKNKELFITYSYFVQFPFKYRRKSVKLDNSDIDKKSLSEINLILGSIGYNCFVDSILNVKENNTNPLISLFTPTYRTGDKINRVYASLLSQTYDNWEWILYDDSNDNDKTFNELKELEKKDNRIFVYKASKSSNGVIGFSKRNAAGLCTGKYLVEMDHDDVLTDDALEYCVKGFSQYPECGFLFSDCSEVLETGGCVNYGDQWLGTHYEYKYKNCIYTAERCSITPVTIRHITASPNHIRAWQSDFYFSIGGHNKDLHIADDYEIVVRSFLNTEILHIPKMLYIQYMNALGNNTQNPRRPEIQRIVDRIAMFYRKDIKNKFEKFYNIEDKVYTDDNTPMNFNPVYDGGIIPSIQKILKI